MLTQRSHLVAVVVGGLYNPYYAAVLEAFAIRLQGAGYQTLLMHTDSGHSLDGVIPRLSSYRVDAIVSSLAVMSVASADALARLKVPVVLLNTAVRNAWVSSVCIDNVGGGRALAEHLLALGARRFAFIAGPAKSSASRDRWRGFRARLAESGAAAIATAAGDYRHETGHAATLDLFARGERPDALFCANDLIAMGAMDALRSRLGLRVPQDVRVAGFDDVPAASWAAYDLTTVVQDASVMAETAVAVLRRRMAQADGGSRTVVPARLVVRGSTRAPVADGCPPAA